MMFTDHKYETGVTKSVKYKNNQKICLEISLIRAAPHVSVWMLLYFTAVIYFLFFHFRQPNLGGLLTDLAEIWHADRKLV